MPSQPSSSQRFNCPICLEHIQGAFVTKCGHSFCFNCISQYTKGKSTPCPVCRALLGESDFFPNYALDELVLNSLGQGARIPEEPGNGAISCAAVILATCINTFIVIKQKIAELIEKKNRLEADSEHSQLHLLLNFLTKLHEKKKRLLDDVTTELVHIEEDIVRVKSKLASESPLPSSLINDENDSVPSISLHDEIYPPAKRLLSKCPPQQPALKMVNLARKVKIEEYFPALEGMYFETDAPLEDFSQKLMQVTGENILDAVASFSLPESIGTTNIISSISFDNCGVTFASAGVSKRIKIFNFDQLEASGWASNFPIQEINARSKLSSVVWNPYIQSQLAAVDYDGVLSIFDSGTGQSLGKFEEHDRRIWSVDYAQMDPTRLATASDDHRIKIWSLNSRKSVCTVDGKANICSVQFSPSSANIIGFGSADHNVHVYDLRFPNRSTCVFQGHKKAVSYVKFLSDKELVSASTDCTLRRWDLAQSEGGDLCKKVYSGHLNEKNFVGLSLSGDFISCGSERNTVFTYHKDMSRPLSSYTFTSPDFPGRPEAEGTNTALPFISSLSWRKNSNYLLAANSTGTIKVLELRS